MQVGTRKNLGIYIYIITKSVEVLLEKNLINFCAESIRDFGWKKIGVPLKDSSGTASPWKSLLKWNVLHCISPLNLTALQVTSRSQQFLTSLFSTFCQLGFEHTRHTLSTNASSLGSQIID